MERNSASVLRVKVREEVELGEELPPGEAASVSEAAKKLKGFFLGKSECKDVDEKQLDDSFGKHVSTARRLLETARDLGQGYVVDSITFRLAVDGRFGFVFVGSVGVEATVEVTIKRAS